MNTAEQQEQSSTSRNAKLLLQNIYFQIFITVLALFSLFSDDIRMAAFPASADFGFDIVHILLICVFLVEIVLNWIALEEYRFSFYFVLDLISSLSILLDISFITDLMYSSKYSLFLFQQQQLQSKTVGSPVQGLESGNQGREDRQTGQNHPYRQAVQGGVSGFRPETGDEEEENVGEQDEAEGQIAEEQGEGR